MSSTVEKGLLAKMQLRTEVIAVALSFVLLGFATGARAVVDDLDVFALVSPDDSVYVCGTTACGDGEYLSGGNATERELTDDGSVGYALFSVYEEGPAGSGLINPFLRFQHNEQSGKGNDTIETAYNTNNDDLQTKNDPGGLLGKYDFENQAKDTTAGGWKDGDFNRAILYSDLLDEDGYFTFLLDINEPNSEDKSTLRLDELSFFISTSDMLGIYDPELLDNHDGAICDSTDAQTAGSAGCFWNAENLDPDPDVATDTLKVWDMDLDKIIGSTMLDNVHDGSAGSGDYDLKVELNTEIFAAYVAAHAGQDLYVYLQNTAGAVNGYETIDAGGEVAAGFEEWAYVGKTTGVPVPGTVLLTALGLLLLGRRVRG